MLRESMQDLRIRAEKEKKNDWAGQETACKTMQKIEIGPVSARSTVQGGRLEDVMAHTASGNHPCRLGAINHRHNNFPDFEARGAFILAPAFPEFLLSPASIVSVVHALQKGVQLFPSRQEREITSSAHRICA